jgi:hypothetical protein
VGRVVTGARALADAGVARQGADQLVVVELRGSRGIGQERVGVGVRASGGDRVDPPGHVETRGEAGPEVVVGQRVEGIDVHQAGSRVTVASIRP